MMHRVLLWVQTCNVKQFLLLGQQAPIVGTGMEKEIVKASGSVVTAKRAGIVEYVSSEKIVLRVDEDAFKNIDDWISQGIDTYHLRKFQRSSYSTWIHHTPIVKRGDVVKVGDILTNGPSIDNGEFALGANLISCIYAMAWIQL